MKRRHFIAGAVSVALVPTPGVAQNATRLRLHCKFAKQSFSYLLEDNATTRDLVSLMPLKLTIEDFSNNEKLAHLPRRLDETGRKPITAEAVGDLCYFRGWGNLAFFHSSYIYRDDLILLGKIEGVVAPLLVKGRYPLGLSLST